MFWRSAFAPRIPPEKFEKEYAYNVRHNYGEWVGTWVSATLVRRCAPEACPSWLLQRTCATEVQGIMPLLLGHLRGVLLA
jgi:hypothetical protein